MLAKLKLFGIGYDFVVLPYGVLGMPTTEEKFDLLHKWYKRIRIAQAGHYQDARRLKQLHLLLGIPVVVLSAVVGTGVFASLTEENLSVTLRIFLGLTSILAAALASLQTFLNYAEQSARHLDAATKLSALKKEMEANLVLLSPESETFDEFIKTTHNKWAAVTAEAPLLSEKAFTHNFRKMGGDQAFPVMNPHYSEVTDDSKTKEV
ncbi:MULTISPECIES: SLATT domain-containing protein [unclassified Leptolyngbya]|uniref:SLATT domain-containing protein n=1 Tax=unclassified Leptolyngbya TaxID=2650499 RepID=UPI0016871725|nr:MULTISPECIES: SLATT domain-containing protein [unclassified Leptolyngbya]MBD1913483.1 SLATT domain-containing protein [Leptolyngbya sp. FACHB-8]MBD2154891.1 SLATT domain-containing protein [Leptolyngbya sp. FACHB-16]